jgi:hypothetical protein
MPPFQDDWDGDGPLLTRNLNRLLHRIRGVPPNTVGATGG